MPRIERPYERPSDAPETVVVPSPPFLILPEPVPRKGRAGGADGPLNGLGPRVSN